MSFSTQVEIRLSDRVTAGLRRVQLGLRKVGEVAVKMGQKLKNAGRAMQGFGQKLTTRLTLPIAALGFGALKAASDIEVLEISFASLAGSAEKGNKILKQLLEFSEVTPFDPDVVARSAKALVGFGIDIDLVQDKLGLLGDIAAGSGVPLTDLASIFGKSAAKGKVMTEELIQLSDRGIPIIKTLTEQFGFTKDKLFKMAETGKISFDILEKALRGMTAEGGLFNKQMELQSKTIAGLFSTLKGRVFLALADIGKVIKETFNLGEFIPKVGDFVKKMVEKFKALSPELQKLIVKGTVLLALLGPVIALIGGLAFVIGAVAASGVLLLKVVAVVALIGVVVGVIIKNFQKLKPFLVPLWTVFGRLTRDLMDKLKTAWIILGPLIEIVAGIVGAAFVVGLLASLAIMDLMLTAFLGIVEAAAQLSSFLGLDIELLDEAASKSKQLRDDLIAGKAGLEASVDQGDVNNLTTSTNKLESNINIELCQDENGKVTKVKAREKDRASSVRVVSRGEMVRLIS